MTLSKITAQKAIEIVIEYLRKGGYSHIIDNSKAPTLHSKDGKNYWLIETYAEYQDYGAIRDGYTLPGTQKEYRTFMVDQDSQEIIYY